MKTGKGKVVVTTASQALEATCQSQLQFANLLGCVGAHYKELNIAECRDYFSLK